MGKVISSSLTKSRIRAAWVFILPTLLVLAFVAGWPLVRTISFAFTDASLINLREYEYIGFDNFVYLFQDEGWNRAVWNTLVFAFTSVSLETIFGLGIALLLHANFKGRAWIRTAVLVPWAIPTIVSAKMWRLMFNDVYGVINAILMKMGCITQPLAWTADPTLSLIAVIMVDVWKTTPFMALLLLAALQMLPQECFEAARVDGIHPLRVFWRVTLPLMKPAIIVAVIFRMLDALRIFDLIYVLTSGSEDTMSMSVFARQQLFDFQSIGLGSAAATLLFFIITLFSVVFLTLGRTKADRQEDH